MENVKYHSSTTEFDCLIDLNNSQIVTIKDLSKFALSLNMLTSLISDKINHYVY